MAQSYYGRPVIKEPVWKWYVPAYLFTGGVAAGTSLIATAAQLTGDAQLARRCRLASLAATSVSGILLVADLGRPARFLNMLRVAKPTSPMSVGSWALAAFAGATAADVLGVARPASGAACTALAPVIGTYTGVLLADTAVPAWGGAYRELPFVFAGGALASGGAVATVLAGRGSRAPRAAAVVGAVVELAASWSMKRRLGWLAQPYHEGRAGRLAAAASALTAAGALLMVGRAPRAGAAALLAGALAERFAVFEAGLASARDPAYTVTPQRERQARQAQ
jgi:formate-dependent nitrite reductase membrane component NrfD